MVYLSYFFSKILTFKNKDEYILEYKGLTDTLLFVLDEKIVLAKKDKYDDDTQARLHIESNTEIEAKLEFKNGKFCQFSKFSDKIVNCKQSNLELPSKWKIILLKEGVKIINEEDKCLIKSDVLENEEDKEYELKLKTCDISNINDGYLFNLKNINKFESKIGKKSKKLIDKDNKK